MVSEGIWHVEDTDQEQGENELGGRSRRSGRTMWKRASSKIVSIACVLHSRQRRALRMLRRTPDLLKMVQMDLRKSLPTLGAGSPEMDGWTNRMVRDYGRHLMGMMMAEAIKQSPSPTIPAAYRTWAARQPRCRWTCGIPHWAMIHMTHALIKLERPGARLEASAPNRSTERPSDELLRLPLYGADADL